MQHRELGGIRVVAVRPLFVTGLLFIAGQRISCLFAWGCPSRHPQKIYALFFIFSVFYHVHTREIERAREKGLKQIGVRSDVLLAAADRCGWYLKAKILHIVYVCTKYVCMFTYHHIPKSYNAILHIIAPAMIIYFTLCTIREENIDR